MLIVTSLLKGNVNTYRPVKLMLLKLLVEGKYSFSFSIPCFFVKEYYITKVFVGCDVSNNDN